MMWNWETGAGVKTVSFHRQAIWPRETTALFSFNQVKVKAGRIIARVIFKGQQLKSSLAKSDGSHLRPVIPSPGKIAIVLTSSHG